MIMAAVRMGHLDRAFATFKEYSGIFCLYICKFDYLYIHA
jgi:hypothetical protein